MDKNDRLIVHCARRMMKKLSEGRVYTCNGEFLPPVREEIKRMRHLCRPMEEKS